jgi:cell wall-associated NlpC family hydrolase
MTLTDFIGIPYQDKGRTFQAFDCWGCVYLFYKEMLRINIPALADDYDSGLDGKAVAHCVAENQAHWIEVDTPEYGDVLVFNVLGWPAHVGVYLGDGDFLHAFKGADSCIERLDAITWNRRHARTYRWPQN